MAKHQWKIAWLLIVSLMIFSLSGCIDMELDLAVNRDGSGKAKIVLAATEPMANEIIDEMVRELRKTAQQAKISEKYENNRKVVEAAINFQDVKELSEYGVLISHSRDDRKHRIELSSTQGIPMKVTLKMPGRITQSNGKHSGSTVRWETSFSGSTYWAESEESAAGTTFAVLIILAAIAGLIVWYFLRRKTPTGNVASTRAMRGGFCTNCGSPFPPDNMFCSRCGSKRES